MVSLVHGRGVPAGMGEQQDAAAEQRERIINGFSAYSAAQSELGRQFARHMHMHLTDSAAVVEIIRAEDRGEPLTPARLAERIGLTSGATSILLNRLENAGQITRTRGHADRRLVTLHTAESMHGAADEHFAPLQARLNAVMSRYPPDQLTLIETFVAELRDTIDDYTRTNDED